jgi:predicted nucleic acid-binding protein
MSGVVSNSTPLIYLTKVGRIDLLRAVFGEVFIPQEVKNEVVDKGKLLGEEDAYIVEKAISEGWLKVYPNEKIEVPMKLHEGEVAALSLAKKLNIKTVLLDEVSARSAARLLDLTPRGTVFVLLKAQEKKEIDLDECIEILNSLIDKGFRLKEEVYIQTIKEARKIAAQTFSTAEFSKR